MTRHHKLPQPKRLFDEFREKGNDFLEAIKWEASERIINGKTITCEKNQLIMDNGMVINDNKRFIFRDYEITDIIGFDTETYQGTCRLLCRSNGSSHYIYDLTSYKKPFKECLDFLFYNAGKKGIWRFFYNIDFDYNAIIKLHDNLDDIMKLNAGIEVEIEGYQITYLKPLMLVIRKGKKKVVITDLYRVFTMSLNQASLEHLKNEMKDNIDGEKLNNDLDYWNDNLDDIIKYCIQDCNLVKKLALKFLEALKEAEISIPKFLCSPASLSKSHFRKNCFMPNLSEIPANNTIVHSFTDGAVDISKKNNALSEKYKHLNVLQIAHDCYYGGRFELLKRGTFNEAYNYDINSEYPTIIAKLFSLKYGLWMRENYHKGIRLDDYTLPKDECFGYFHVKIHVPDDNYISTIPIRWKGMIRFPNGYFEGWFTWYDLDLMREHITEINEALVYREGQIEYKPFEREIKKLYELKSKYKGKNNLMYLIFKLTMNALYGCFFEIHDCLLLDEKTNEYESEKRAGILYNPVYASQITAFGRWKILKDVWSIREKLIGFHTDSIISEIPLNEYLDIGKELGQWELDGKGKLYIINTGMYQIGDKIRTRGVPAKYIVNWFDFAKENALIDKKIFEVKRMTKLCQSLIQFKNLDYVNIMRDNKKTVNINSDKKREWIDKFKNFDDTLKRNIDSLPLVCFRTDDLLDLIPNPLYCFS